MRLEFSNIIVVFFSRQASNEEGAGGGGGGLSKSAISDHWTTESRIAVLISAAEG